MDMYRTYTAGSLAGDGGRGQVRIRAIATLVSGMIYKNRDALMASMIVAGVDKTEGAQVYAVPIGGGLFEQPFAVSGSGSTFIYGYCDTHWKENMSEEDAVAFATQAVTLAMERDGSSGGLIRIVVLPEAGESKEHEIPWDDLPHTG